MLIAITSFVLSFIGATVGLVLGHLRLPLLITYLGGPGAGAAMNLTISASGALAGASRHALNGRISWSGLAIMGIPSAIGAIIAVKIFIQVNPIWSYLIIGVVLVMSGLKMIFNKPPDLPPGEISMTRRIMVESVIGLGLGALAAITGLMLGSLRLPMMIRYLRMDLKEAVGTNMAVGCLTGIVGALSAFAFGAGKLNFLVLAVVIPPTLIGGCLGGWLTGRFTKETVQKLAGWIISITGAILVAQGCELYLSKSEDENRQIIVNDAEYEGYSELETDPPMPDDETDPEEEEEEEEEEE